ncbi:predicted protein, partial [Nematostella vectensis]
VVLDTVFGLTAGTNASLSCNAVTGVVAYPAGCVTVLFNPLTGAQDFIHNTLRKTISCLSFSKDGKYLVIGESTSFFVTCGVRHLKFWYFEEALNKPKDNSIPLSGRSALLGEERNSAFCDVVCGIGKTADYTYSVTSNGKLCAFGASRSLEKSFELRASRALCLAVSEQFICCGCTNGIVSSPNNMLNFELCFSCEDEKESDLYPDAIALSMDPKHNKVTCLYNDRSLYVWEMLDIDKIVKSFSSLYHSSGIWGIKAAVKLAELNGSTSPYGTFLTCSSDDTVRFWDMDRGTLLWPVYNRLSVIDDIPRLVYSSLTVKNVRQASKEDQRRGIKTVAISADGKLLAVGDKIGNVRIYDTVHMKERYKISAHESEVLCVEFSPLKSGIHNPQCREPGFSKFYKSKLNLPGVFFFFFFFFSGYNLLVSAGRDRLIHVYNASEDFTLLQTLDDHSASIASIKFHGSNGEFQLLSCGADRTIYFRVARKEPQLMFVRTTNVVNKTGLRDMAIDCSRNLAAVACQDRTISCSDKTLSFLDLDSGECVATLSGHSEQSTDMLFSSDCSRLITVSADG